MLGQLKGAIRRSREQARHRRDYRALLQLYERMLEDIGLPREEVQRRLDRAA